MPGPNDVSLGSLRHRVTIQQATRTRGANGEPLEAWADVETVWAKVEPLTSRELFAAGQAQLALSHRVTIRYRADVTATGHRLDFEGRTLNIAARHDPKEARRWLELLCQERDD